jgi:hypothetical protein
MDIPTPPAKKDNFINFKTLVAILLVLPSNVAVGMLTVFILADGGRGIPVVPVVLVVFILSIFLAVKSVKRSILVLVIACLLPLAPMFLFFVIASFIPPTF